MPEDIIIPGPIPVRVTNFPAPGGGGGSQVDPAITVEYEFDRVTTTFKTYTCPRQGEFVGQPGNLFLIMRVIHSEKKVTLVVQRA